MARAIRKKSGTGVKTNWHFVWSCSEIDKMITRTDPMIPKEKELEFPILGGELSNSAATSVEDIDKNGKMQYLRRLNGDQDHQGRHVRIACGDWKILHVRLYDY